MSSNLGGQGSSWVPLAPVCTCCPKNSLHCSLYLVLLYCSILPEDSRCDHKSCCLLCEVRSVEYLFQVHPRPSSVLPLPCLSPQVVMVGHASRTCRTVCSPRPHPHVASVTSGTRLWNKKCRSPIFSVRSWIRMELSGLGSDV